MSFDFPQERQVEDSEPKAIAQGVVKQGTVIDPEPLLIPPVFATVQQLEEVNRQLTAIIMALFKMMEDRVIKEQIEFHGNEFTAEFRKMFAKQVSLYREDILKELDAKLAANIARVAGFDREKQAQYLQRHPEAILFSGEFARRE